MPYLLKSVYVILFQAKKQQQKNSLINFTVASLKIINEYIYKRMGHKRTKYDDESA